MSVFTLAEPTAEQQQLANYNSNVGGNLNRRVTFSVPPDIAWAVVGCVLADSATAADVENTLVPAVEALTEVTSVNGDQFFGQLPAVIEAAGHECVLHVTSMMTSAIGSGGDVFTQQVQNHESLKPPLDKKWCLLVLRVPAELDDTSISALETAITGIAGVTTTEHLIDGVTSSRQSGNANLTISAHLRIDPVEV